MLENAVKPIKDDIQILKEDMKNVKEDIKEIKACPTIQKELSKNNLVRKKQEK